jgi:hypothetical protein
MKKTTMLKKCTVLILGLFYFLNEIRPYEEWHKTHNLKLPSRNCRSNELPFLWIIYLIYVIVMITFLSIQEHEYNRLDH